MAKSFTTPQKPATASANTVTRFRVHLNCPTPLVVNPLDVEATTADEAWQKFCAANGIIASRSERTITPLDEPNPSLGDL